MPTWMLALIPSDARTAFNDGDEKQALTLLRRERDFTRRSRRSGLT